MSLASAKIELTRLILETKDEALLRHLQAIMETRQENWWENLPEEIKASILKGLEQSENKEGITHETFFSKYEKWLKK